MFAHKLGDLEKVTLNLRIKTIVMSDCFVQRVNRYILEHHMIRPGEIVVVGVSGGVDSLSLLYCLHALRHEFSCSLHVAHLDHGIRPDSVADAEYVHKLAEELNLPISVEQVDVPQMMRHRGLSVEAAAREARFDFYERVSEQIGATKIALGHHRGDQAETVLMRLLRGAGSIGLKGMLPVREGKFIRPLLNFSREEIEAFAAELGLQPRRDSTNYEPSSLRNRIRLELIPLLEQLYNPNIQNTINQTAELLRVESDYLEGIGGEAFQACREKPDVTDVVVLNRRTFLRYHLAVRQRILRCAIGEFSGNMTSFYFNHFSAMLKLIEGESPNASLNLPGNLRLQRAYDQLIFHKSEYASNEFEYEVVVPGTTDLPLLNARIIATVEASQPAKLPDGKFRAVFDFFQSPLKLRNRWAGDRFQPFGMQGSKKVKDFLIDSKVPRQERDRVPILVSGEEIVWVVGHRTSERFKVGDETKRCVYLAYTPYDGLAD